MRLKIQSVLCFLSLACNLFAEVYYEGTNTFRGYGAVNYSWMVQFLPYNPTIVDIGAYYGEQTQQAGKTWPHGVVFACEPHPETYQKLHQRISAEGLSNIKIYHLALSDCVGSTILYEAKDDTGLSELCRQESSLFRPDQETIAASYEVPVTTLDLFCAQEGIKAIDILSLDTEGAELSILQHSLNILKTVKLLIVPSFFYAPRMGIPNYFVLKEFLTRAQFVPLAHWYTAGGRGKAVYISQELYDAYFVRCLGLGLGGLAYP